MICIFFEVYFSSTSVKTPLGSSQMKGRKAILALAVVIIAASMITSLAVAEPNHPSAPISFKKESIFPYQIALSPLVSFPTEARLFHYLGLEYIPTPILKLYYVCPECGEDFATEGQLFHHMNMPYA